MSVQQGFPQLSSPIADLNGNGRVTQPWQQFFISLWNRTGAQQGGSTFNPGDLKPIAGAGIPVGWLVCDGSAVSRTQYVALFNAISTLWGSGDNVTTFNIPDLRGSTVIGSNVSFPLGSTGGASSITLSLGNLPTHSHTINDPGHFHPSVVAASNVTAGASAGGVTAGNTGTATTGIIATNNTGSGTPFSILSPYGAANWIVKT